MAEKQDFLIVQVHVAVPLPADNITTWPEERCQRQAEEIAGDIAGDWPNVTLHEWWVA